jgi:hypothetical protein
MASMRNKRIINNRNLPRIREEVVTCLKLLQHSLGGKESYEPETSRILTTPP